MAFDGSYTMAVMCVPPLWWEEHAGWRPVER